MERRLEFPFADFSRILVAEIHSDDFALLLLACLEAIWSERNGVIHGHGLEHYQELEVDALMVESDAINLVSAINYNLELCSGKSCAAGRHSSFA